MDLDNAPEHILVSILVHLDYKSLVRTKALSNTWLGLTSRNQHFWRQKFEMDFGEWEGGGNVDFEKEYKIEYGWRFKEPRVVELEALRYTDDMKVKEGVILSVSGGDANVWDLERMECAHEFKEATSATSIESNSEDIFIGLETGEIHVWSLETNKMHHRWKAHEGCVNFLSFSSGDLISGDKDCIKIWDAYTFECMVELDLEKATMLCVVGKHAFVGFKYENPLLVLDREKGEWHTLYASRWPRCVSANSKYIFAGCENGSIDIWDKQTMKEVDSFFGADGLRGLWCDAWKLVSVSYGGWIKIWDLKSLKCIRSTQLNVSPIMHMECWKGKVVLSSRIHRMYVLDFDV